MHLIRQLAQQGGASQDPVLRRVRRRQPDRDDEIGRVTGGRQHASSLAGLVHGTRVRALVLHFLLGHRYHPDLKAAS